MTQKDRHLSHASPIDDATGKQLGVSGELFRSTIYEFFHVAYSLIDIRRHAANSIGLNSAQFSVLSMADALSPDATPSEIAKALHVTTAFVTIESAKLESMGYIEKKTNPEDARSVLIVLTKLGSGKFDEAYVELRHMNSVLFAGFDAQDFAALRGLVAKLGEGAEIALADLPGSGSERLSRVA